MYERTQQNPESHIFMGIDFGVKWEGSNEPTECVNIPAALTKRTEVTDRMAESHDTTKPFPGKPFYRQPSLSFPPSYPYRPLNESYFKVPHESLSLTGISGFHERTISRTSGLEKDKARWRIVNTILRTLPKEVQNPRFVTTPGAWWHFERLIEGRLEHRKRKPHFVGFERDPELYRLAAVMMGAIFHGSGVVVLKDGDVDLVSSRHGTKILRNQDVFEFLSGSSKGQAKLAGAWLDLTSTITTKLPEKLALLAKWMRKDYFALAITLIRGRECGEIRDRLNDGAKRKRILERMVRSSCGDDFRITDLFDYKDSTPMQQVIFMRGTHLSEGRPRP